MERDHQDGHDEEGSTPDAKLRKHGRLENPRHFTGALGSSNDKLQGSFRGEMHHNEVLQASHEMSLHSPHRSLDESDSENVIQDESELSSKAFEARVS